MTKIVVSLLSDNKVTSATVKSELQKLGLEPISIRKRKIKHVSYQWWVVLPSPLLDDRGIPMKQISIWDSTCPISRIEMK
jgi:hypothetical protein